MLISSPFLLPRRQAETDEDFLTRTMIESGDDAEGAFPIGADRNWHGGIHLTAPLDPNGGNPLPVRAIADGVVDFARQSTPQRRDSPIRSTTGEGGQTTAALLSDIRARSGWMSSRRSRRL